MAPQVMLTYRMLSDTPNGSTGQVDLLLSGEMSLHEILNKTHEIQNTITK